MLGQIQRVQNFHLAAKNVYEAKNHLSGNDLDQIIGQAVVHHDHKNRHQTLLVYIK